MLKFVAIALAAASFGWIANYAEADDAKEQSLTTATYAVTGLHCPPCTRTVESSLSRAKGIRSVKVDWATKSARVQFDEKALSAQQLADLVAKTPHMMGGGMKYSGALALSVPELRDQETAKTATAALEKVSGVAKVNTFPARHMLTVQFSQGTALTSTQLIDALDKVGMKAKTY